MRNDLTSISVFSMAISFVAAIVVCMQVGQTEALPGWKMPEAIVWSLEVAIFGVAVLAWQPQISLLGWVIGIGALSVLRSAVGLAAAVTLVEQPEKQARFRPRQQKKLGKYLSFDLEKHNKLSRHSSRQHFPH